MKNKKNGFVDVLVGLQWGDEGKGKNIDELLSQKLYQGVARFQGGANAGHTIKFKNQSFIGHIIPSGCLQKNIELYIGSGVVIDINSLAKEIAELKKIKINVKPNLYISNRAKLVSYLHPFLDQAEEHYRNKNNTKIGTTARGIGPTYSDARARRVLLMGDIQKPDFKEKEKNLSSFHLNLLKMYQEKYNFKIPYQEIKLAQKKWWQALEIIKKLAIVDLASLIQKRLQAGHNILAEGAQGIMLDIDYGDYPNVTSSNTLPVNACLSLGIPHTYLRNIYGVMKTYTTKVGGGHFPARILNTKIEKLFQEAGFEFGATTGRPRMCGWLDLFALRQAIKLSGVNKIFINKADVCPVTEIEVIINYKKDNKIITEFPFRLNEVNGIKNEKMPGWGKDNFGVNKKEKISPELLNYLSYLQNKLKDLKVEIISVGTGPKREHTFYLK